MNFISSAILRQEDIKWSKSVIENLLEKVINKCGEYGVRILIALLFLVIGFKIIKVFVRFIKKSFEKHHMEPSVATFLVSLITITLKVLVVITAASILGIAMTSFITILGTAGVALGLALQGSLSNLAGGVLILLLKPYRIGDYIKSASGEEGTVVSIDIFYTKLRSVDNQTIVIPNGMISNSSITNVTKADYRRIDLEVDIAYDADIKQARDVLQGVIDQEEAVVKEKGTDVFVSCLGASGVTMGIHVWVDMDSYWPVRWRLLENVKYALDKAGIEIPYNTIDVNLNK